MRAIAGEPISGPMRRVFIIIAAILAVIIFFVLQAFLTWEGTFSEGRPLPSRRELLPTARRWNVL
jgi:hypothetical protein